MKTYVFIPTFPDWQRAARAALANEITPSDVVWVEAGDEHKSLELFDSMPILSETKKFRVPKPFLDMAKLVALHTQKSKWALLYRALWRLTHGETNFLENPVDPDFIALRHLEKEVSKDAYRMRAFLRFRETKIEGEPWFVAWYESEHDTVHLNEKFFTDRFTNMRWSILTPKRCMHWNSETVSFSEGVEKSIAPASDDTEPLWISYYSNIFNPARIKPRVMQAQLLKRNWKNLPEAVVIEPLLKAASRRTNLMIQRSDFQRVSDDDFLTPKIPSTVSLDVLRDSAKTCRACPLWKNATCTVFGEGPPAAKIVFVGEQPGDQEDRAGKPFVGPAGQVFDRALAAAGVDRLQTYVTNAVKHFKFEPRGKRRIHKTASAREIAACRPWLESELDLIQPQLVVALGGTAAHSLFGSPLKILKQRGTFLKNSSGFDTLITVHPSSLLRLPPDVNFENQFALFVDDLKKVNLFFSNR